MKLPKWVYAITLEATGKIYVGMTQDPAQRYRHHTYLLRKGKHPVEDMQADYNTYGGPVTIRVLDKVETPEEKGKEFGWQLNLRTLERGQGYNYKDPVTNWCLPLPERRTP